MNIRRFLSGFFAIMLVLVGFGPSWSISVQSVNAASANICTEPGEILLNGGFEATDDRIGSHRGEALNALVAWDIFGTLPDVTDGAGTSWYVDDGTDGIEVDLTGTITDSFEGSHHIELDSHPTGGTGTNSAVSQDVTVDGGEYELSYYYKPRTDTADDNIVELKVDGVVVHTANETETTQPDWVQVVVSIDLDPGDHTITLQGAGLENNHGGVADAVSLTCADPVLVCTYNDGIRVNMRWGDIDEVVDPGPPTISMDGDLEITNGMVELFDTITFNPGDAVTIETPTEIAWESEVNYGIDGILFDAFSLSGEMAEITVESLEYGPLTYTFDDIRAGVSVPFGGLYTLSLTVEEELTGPAICPIPVCTYNDGVRLNMEWGDVDGTVPSGVPGVDMDGNAIIADGELNFIDTIRFNASDSVDIDTASEIAWTSKVGSGSDGIIFDAYSLAGSDAEITVESLEYGPLTYTFDELRSGISEPFGGVYSLSIEVEKELASASICPDPEGTITVYKDVITDDGATFVEGDFAPTIDSVEYAWGETVRLSPGDYTIAENELTAIAEAYDVTFSGDCAADGSITLADGEDLTCTITNNDTPPVCEYDDAINIQLLWGDVDSTIGSVPATFFDGTVIPSDGYVDLLDTIKWDSRDEVLLDSITGIHYGSRIVSGYDGLDFNAFQITGETSEITIDSIDYGPLSYTFDEIRAGVEFDVSPYIVRMVATDLGSVERCAGPSVGADDATLTIVKEIDAASTASVTADDFALYADSTEFENGVSQIVTAGTYTISEKTSVSFPYTATFSGACDGTDEVKIAGGEDLTCTISNLVTDSGTVTLDLEIINDDGGSFMTDQFQLFANSTLFANGETQQLPPDTYAITEDYDAGGFTIAAVADGFTTSFSGHCNSSGLLNVSSGGTYTCTITVDDIAASSSGGGSGGGGSGGGGAPPAPAASPPSTPPTPSVLGVTDEIPVEEIPAEDPEEVVEDPVPPVEDPAPPQPQVLGVTDELPRTGIPAGMLLLVPFGVLAARRKKK